MSETIQDDDVASPERVTRLGEELRAARIAHSMEISDVAQRLNLELHVVEGLEAGNYERLPEPAYIRGYIMAYLRLMELPLSMLESFDEQFPVDGPLATSPGISSGSACSRDGWVRCISTGLIVLLIIAIGLWLLEESFHILNPKTEPVTAQQVEETSYEPEPDTESLPLEVQTDITINEEAPALEDSDMVESAADVTTSDATLDMAAAGNAAETVAVASEPEQQAEIETEIPALPRLEMKFLGTSWVRVDDSSGSKLKAGTFNEGQEVSIEHAGELRLIIGRSNSVELIYAGQPVDLSEFKSGVARLVLGKPAE